jgi:hypothetical protein
MSHLIADDDDSSRSELMDIQITVYSLSGILQVEKQAKPRMKTAQISSSSNRPNNVPTTAVIAVANEKVQTFLPSMPLASQVLSKQSGVARYSAYWRDDGCSGMTGFGDCDTQPCTTFEISRVMQRESYRPGTKIGQVSHYVCERIDLNISVGQGKDIQPLGVASIVISGDDDGEVLMNAPVKQVAASDGPRGIRSGVTYSFEENATLRLGVRVFPHHLKDRMQTRGDFYLDCDSDDACSKVVAVEIDKKHSILASFLRNKSKRALYTDDGKTYIEQYEPVDRVHLPVSADTQKSDKPALFFNAFFCGTISYCITQE